MKMPVKLIKLSAYKTHIKSSRFHSALKPMLIMAQYFALFPVEGVGFKDSSTLRFSWKSFKTLYCCFFILSMAIVTLFNIHGLIITPVKSYRTSNLMFFAMAGITGLLFLNLARSWPKIVLSWNNMERKLTIRSIPPKRSLLTLHLKLKIITIFIMVLALVEHILSITSGYLRAMACVQVHKNTEVIDMYILLRYSEIFASTNYSRWKAVIITYLNVVSTFSWNFLDVFLILISIALTDQFKQFNHKLKFIQSKEMPISWWMDARVDFNQLATMIRLIDSKISGIVLLSFSTNLYFICIQLLNSFNKMPNSIHTIYFCFSFGFLLLRTAAVSLYAADIHEESLIPATILYSISRENYSKEVQRFLFQVTTDHISLTGMKFFSVTRSLILTVVGTVVTYELVLIQFNAIQDQKESRINDTLIC